MKSHGILLVRDPRVSEQENSNYLDMLERYFDQPAEAKMADVRADVGYQVGATPERVEVPRCAADPNCEEVISNFGEEHKPTLPLGPDLKWRFFWRIGERPVDTKFPELNCPAVIPAAFPEWETVMNRWGDLMHGAVNTVGAMVGQGLGLGREVFPKMSDKGQHLLAPTGSDLGRYDEKGSIFAGFHYDLNFLTIHGKSRFPGLYIWLRTGEKMRVSVPDGCLLVQAGKQLEWLTGGAIRAGYHEVVFDETTRRALDAARAANRPLWRVSSTMFHHINSDATLEPLGPFATEEACKAYPPTLCGDYVTSELEVIQLRKPDEEEVKA
ncbi:hypothetical protein H696_01068 [Fonticula alba]|uniref:Isopenicillin N synthase-like Fe(2+) 2OG dioxygenase domain-containing protein n=1 Tax=Fonticula alba TaxID=691883 RepID=A0A058ZB75_FONAL|nr:hypothetical protein H696_01068 [Fonticula alba]KCV71649.1 hypothetical protein H696_01068 [Fonticula alba]|eukprot:XP_009493227.1 hypothetical protein H696_01068 [Fonticula alba]